MLEIDLQLFLFLRRGELGHDAELLLEILTEAVDFLLGGLVDGLQLLVQVIHKSQLFHGLTGHLLDLGLVFDGLFKMLLDLPLQGGPLALELANHRAIVLQDRPPLLELPLDGLDLLAGFLPL